MKGEAEDGLDMKEGQIKPNWLTYHLYSSLSTCPLTSPHGMGRGNLESSKRELKQTSFGDCH